jgi:TonB family protein
MSRFLFFVSALAIVLCCVAPTLFAQMTNGSDTEQNRVVLSKLPPPVYPPLARQAHIWGDVNLTLRIRQDGSVESASLVSGHAMLKQSALDSAQKSEFECHACSETLTSYSLVYTFKFTEKKCCTEKEENEPQPRFDVTQSQNHITILTDTACICDPSADVRRVRSAKCMYLWRCASR